MVLPQGPTSSEARSVATSSAWTPRWRISKRAFDLALATALLIPAMIGVLVLGLVVAASLRTWPIFTQLRLGLHGKPFRFVKIRTLPRTTPAYVDKYALRTLPISPLGRWLRAKHLDELPQILLVITGRLSFVGPRAEMPTLAKHWSPEFRDIRLSVRPGITGLWQISEAADRLIHECPEFDILYVANSSPRLDLWILWRTALAVTPWRQYVEFDSVAALSAISEPNVQHITSDRGPTDRSVPA